MWEGAVAGLFTAAGAGKPMDTHDEVRLVAGAGIDGDRYAARTGKWSDTPATGRQLTLIEAEAIEALAREHGIELAAGETRRNLTTRGISLNDHLPAKLSQLPLRQPSESLPCYSTN